MLFLLFRLTQDRYALDVRQIVEVLPLIEIKRIPLAPRGVAGVLHYRGGPVPAIDVGELAFGRPAPARLSTRIVLVRYPDVRGTLRLLGLILERATETVRLDPADFASSQVASGPARFLGPVASDPNGLIQRIEVDGLLTDLMREVLFPPEGLTQ